MTDDKSALRRDYLISDLQAVMQECDVDATVAVQARQSVEETEWLLNLAVRHPFILGVAGWVPLVNPAVEKDIARFAQNSRLKAVRHVLHDEPDDHYMLRDDFNRGVSLLQTCNLAYDILIFERHLPQTLTFVDRHPNQVFVVDHIAKPRIKGGVISPWKELIHELTRRENVYCKLSGLATEADWNNWIAQDLRPCFDAVLSAFGPQRLIFGSDWPVVTLAGGYAKWLSAFRSFIAELSPAEQSSICHGSAIAAYSLQSEAESLRS